MQSFRNPFDRSLAPEKKYTLPVKALSDKLKSSQPGKSNQYFVKCVSHMPLASDTSKEQIRMNYLHGVIEGKVSDTRFNKSLSQSHMPMGPANSIPIGLPPTQTIPNPFTKPPTFPQPQSFTSFSSSHSTMPSLSNNKPQIPLSSNNPFIPKQNQLQGNHYNCSNQPKHFTTMSGMSTPGLVRQPSFGLELNTSFGKSTGMFGNAQTQQGTNQGQQTGQGILGSQSSAGIRFGAMNTSSNPLGGNTSLQAPGQLAFSPSFGTINQSTQPLTSTFGQPTTQPQQNSLFAPKLTNSILVSQTNPLQENPPAQTLTAPNLQNTNPPQPTTTLDQNIKQLLDSKPNLWNILALDPQYQHGFNQSGRMYVKSVLQRIIDQNILSEQSLNKVIVQIYKQMYGAENFEKILQSKKKQILNDDKISNWKISELLGKEFNKKMTQSVFPKDIDSIGEDFYRSFKRRSTKFFDEPFLSVKKDDEYERKLQRKFYNIKRVSKPTELKVKFVELNRPQERAKIINSPYTPQGLDQISQAITEIRNEHRRQLMPKQEELPKIEGFTIIHSLTQLKNFTRYQLLSVPKVTISNEFGSIRFKAPISLLNKNIADSLIINQRSVQIMDQQWKVRDAEITFKKFADFSQLDEQQQDALEDKIVAWCEKEKFQFVRVDKNKGLVVIEV